MNVPRCCLPCRAMIARDTQTQSDEAISTQKQLMEEMLADLVGAQKAEEDCKTNHAALIAAEKRTSPVQEGRASVSSASKADEAADAERPVFEVHPVQSTAALSCAGQAETTIEEWTFESQVSVSHAAVRSQCSRAIQRQARRT